MDERHAAPDGLCKRRPLRRDDVLEDAGGLRARRLAAAGGHRLRQQRIRPVVREPCGAAQPPQGRRAAREFASELQQPFERHRLPDRGRLLGHHRAGVSAGGDPPRQRLRTAHELRRRRLGRTVRRRAVCRGILHGRREPAPGRGTPGDPGRVGLRADGPQRPRLAQGESGRLDEDLGEDPGAIFEEVQFRAQGFERRHRRAPQRRDDRPGPSLRRRGSRQVDGDLDARRVGFGLQSVERRRIAVRISPRSSTSIASSATRPTTRSASMRSARSLRARSSSATADASRGMRPVGSGSSSPTRRRRPTSSCRLGGPNRRRARASRPRSSRR